MTDPYTTPEFSRSALITIDTQADTLDGQPLEIPGTSHALPFLRQLLDAYRKQGLPIVHMVRIYRQDGSNADLCRRSALESGVPMLIDGSPGCEIAPDLFEREVKLNSRSLLTGRVQKITDKEIIIHKPRWGAFYQTPLEGHLHGLGVSTLVFTGCNFPNCPRTSIYEAGERDYRIALVTDAVSGLYDRAEQEMKHIGVNLFSTQELLVALTKEIEGKAS